MSSVSENFSETTFLVDLMDNSVPQTGVELNVRGGK